MNYKIIFLITGLILLGYSAKSQSNEISTGLHSGLNFQTFSGKNIEGNKLNLNFVPRFNVGVFVNIPIASEFYIKSGLLFTTKGAKSDQFLGMNMAVEYNIAYIELPLSLLYKVALGNGHILLGCGPYISYGIVGNAEYTIANTTVKEKIEFTNEYESSSPLAWNNFKPFDYGANLFFGYELKNGFSWQLNTQPGMLKINAENKLLSYKTIFKNTGYGLAIEFKF